MLQRGTRHGISTVWRDKGVLAVELVRFSFGGAACGLEQGMLWLSTSNIVVVDKSETVFRHGLFPLSLLLVVRAPSANVCPDKI